MSLSELLDPKIITGLSGLLGGMGGCLVYLKSDGVKLRRELWARVAIVEEQNKKKIDELDHWKEKHFEMVQLIIELKANLLQHSEKIKILTQEQEMSNKKTVELLKENEQLKIQCRAIGLQLDDIKERFLPREKHEKYGHEPDEDS